MNNEETRLTPRASYGSQGTSSGSFEPVKLLWVPPVVLQANTSSELVKNNQQEKKELKTLGQLNYLDVGANGYVLKYYAYSDSAPCMGLLYDVRRLADVQSLLDIDRGRLSVRRSQHVIYTCPRSVRDRNGVEVPCTREFQYLSRLEKHFKDDLAHQKEGNDFLCMMPGKELGGICGKTYTTQANLKVHMDSFHGSWQGESISASSKSGIRKPLHQKSAKLSQRNSPDGRDIDGDQVEDDEVFESEEPF